MATLFHAYKNLRCFMSHQIMSANSISARIMFTRLNVFGGWRDRIEGEERVSGLLLLIVSNQRQDHTADIDSHDA